MNTIFSTSYFGNILYYSQLIKCASISIEAKEHFIKQTYRNRCEILTANGIQVLSIPVIRKNGSKTSTDEVEISLDTDWRKDHWKAIESAYSSSPYFEHYGGEIKELIYQNETNLLKFNKNIQDRIQSWLGIATETEFTTEYKGVDDGFVTNLKSNSYIEYIQVFGEPLSFKENLSIVDAIFCLGPMARKLLIE